MTTHRSRRAFLKHGGAAALSFWAAPAVLPPRPGRSARAAPGPPKASVAELRELVPKLMAEFGVPGLSVALVSDSEIVWRQGYGVRNLATREAVTPDTIFEAASLSKPAFAYAVLGLRDQGVLGLDTPLVEYLPEPLIPDEPRFRRITARMCLSHTSGLPQGRRGDGQLTMRSEPGTQFHYSATGYDYLQKVVERLTRQPLEELMRRGVLAPHGMSASNFGWAAGYETKIARGYDRKNKPGRTFNERYRTATAGWRDEFARRYPELSYPSAAAGLYSTPGDFAKFLCEIIEPSQKGENSPAGRTLTDMLTPQVYVSDVVTWGLGWGLLRTRVGEVFWHWGNWNGLFQHFAAASRGKGDGIVIMTNSGNGLRLCKTLVPKAIDLDIAPLRRFID